MEISSNLKMIPRKYKTVEDGVLEIAVEKTEKKIEKTDFRVDCSEFKYEGHPEPVKPISFKEVER